LTVNQTSSRFTSLQLGVWVDMVAFKLFASKVIPIVKGNALSHSSFSGDNPQLFSISEILLQPVALFSTSKVQKKSPESQELNAEHIASIWHTSRFVLFFIVILISGKLGFPGVKATNAEIFVKESLPSKCKSAVEVIASMSYKLYKESLFTNATRPALKALVKPTKFCREALFSKTIAPPEQESNPTRLIKLSLPVT